MGYKIKNSKVMKMTKMNLTGNIVPISWFNHLKFESGKPNLPAIMILSDIIYWYRAQKVRDEETGMVVEYKQKFKKDMLQKQYKLWMDLFGFGRSQTKNAIDYLEKEGLINREFRDITLKSGEIAYNRMFVEPIPEAIEKITYPEKEDTQEGSFENEEGVISKSGGGHSENTRGSFQKDEDPVSKSGGGHSDVNSTESTTESTTENTTEVNNNKKGENEIFEKSSLQKITLQLFKEAFGNYPNSIQLRKLEAYNFDEELFNKTIEGIAIGGHNETFMFNKFDMFAKDNIKSLTDLRNLKTKGSNSTYKWADHFFDWDSLKPSKNQSDSKKENENSNDQSEPSTSNNKSYNANVLEKVKKIDDPLKEISKTRLLKKTKEVLKKAINNQERYETWFKDLIALDFNKKDKIFVVETVNNFKREWIEDNYGEFIGEILYKLLNEKISVKFEDRGQKSKEE